MTSPTVSESPVWQPHFLHSHTHTLTELYFTLVGAVCYPSGSVPSACLPAHHIHPIMLHCLGCSGTGRPPIGKTGGGHEEEEREGESEEKRRSHADTEAGTLRPESGLALFYETRNPTAPTKSYFIWVCIHNNFSNPISYNPPYLLTIFTHCRCF